MNPNWTGRTARTLGECRFADDADPIERHRNSSNYGTAWWVAVCIVSLLGAMAIVHFGV
jgi:hypothetical protein